MARYSDELIRRIKQEVSLLAAVQSHGLELKKQGENYMGHCPFHIDRTPSFVITPGTNLWNCLGACNTGGSVIDWEMKTKHLDFRQAVESLAKQHPSLAAELAASTQDDTNRASAFDFTADIDDQTQLNKVIDFYHGHVNQAQPCLEKRGLNDPELIEHFKLGCATRELGQRLPPKNRKAGAEIREQLQRIGIIRESGHEHFNGSLVIPIINNGYVTEVYGRKIIDRLRKGTPKHLYLPGPHKGVFNLAAFTGTDEIILCESLIDALTFWRHGFKHVTTSYGIGGFTDELKQAFIDHQVKRVLIAYDRDDAGDKGANAVAAQLLGLGIDCYRLNFPKGMDANEYALKMNPPRKSLELVIRKAEWLGDATNASSLEKSEQLKADAEQEPTLETPKSEEAAIPPLAAKTPLPATPIPETTTPTIDAEVTANETIIRFDQRRYRIRGLDKANSYEQLKINLCVSEGDNLHVDQLDLYNAKQRQSFIKLAASELNTHEQTIKKDLAHLLLKLEQLQDEKIKQAISPKSKTVPINQKQHQDAVDLLQDKNLLNRILDDLHRAGVVGEQTNKLVAYLAAVSRKLDNPLAVIIQSTSAAGKSSLMNAVLTMMPDEECIQYSAMTGQSLFYMGETNLKHKILAIAEEEGAHNASYALKLLQSEGELTIASTGKDADGNLTTQEYRVEGPVMLFSTTTAIDIDEELMNRCLVLTVNESREQTQLIHELQRERETIQGLIAKEEKQSIIEQHRNAQRLLKPIKVANPYADQLTFTSSQTRSRRDHMKYLRLIKTVTLLHQYQRPIKSVQHKGKTIEYIEVELHDIAIANELAHEILGRSMDELPPQTRKLLTLIYEMVTQRSEQQKLCKQDIRFSRRDIREYTGWGLTQVAVHCQRLEEMEYLMVYTGRNGQKVTYQLCYDGEGENREQFMLGLIDVQKLGYDADLSDFKLQLSGCFRGAIGTLSARFRGDEIALNATTTEVNHDSRPINGKTHNYAEKNNASHPKHVIVTQTQPIPPNQ